MPKKIKKIIIGYVIVFMLFLIISPLFIICGIGNKFYIHLLNYVNVIFTVSSVLFMITIKEMFIKEKFRSLPFQMKLIWWLAFLLNSTNAVINIFKLFK
jgi:hypothetical protein